MEYCKGNLINKDLSEYIERVSEMNKKLLIVGAGIYGVVAKEIAESMSCFEKISFVDDEKKKTQDGIEVVGTTADLDKLAVEYSNIIVAIGNSDARLSLLNKIEEELPFAIATLISPKAYISPSAQIGKASIIEPMAVVHTGAVISRGCIISAGAVVNHGSVCEEMCHIDCNAVVGGQCTVPVGTKVCRGEVYKKDAIKTENLFFDPQRRASN